MNISVNAYGYGRGGECVYIFRYISAGVKAMKIKMEKESRHMSRVMRTSIGTVT